MCKRHVFFGFLREIALFFPFVLYWYGLWNILDIYVLPESKPHRDVAYAVFGVLWLSLRRVFAQRSDRHGAKRSKLSAKRFHCRVKLLDATKSVLDETGYVIGWTGMWNVLEALHSGTKTLERDLFYVVCSAVVFVVVDVVARDESLKYYRRRRVTVVQ